MRFLYRSCQAASLALVLGLLAGAAQAADIPIGAKKLVVRDRSAVGAKSSAVYVAPDRGAGIEVGTARDPRSVEADFEILYPGGESVARFRVPAGNPPTGRAWRVVPDGFVFSNKETDPAAEGNLTSVKNLVARAGRILKLVARSSGDLGGEIAVRGAPVGPVDSILTLRNGAEENRYCTRFESCRFKSAGGGLLANLVCKNGAPLTCPASTGRSRIEKAREPSHLWVVRTGALARGDQVMLGALQGLVARYSKEQIYLDPEAGGYRGWVEDLASTENVTWEEVTDPWWLVDRYRHLLRGHVVWQDGDSSVNVATSLAGPESALVVDAAMEGRALARGLERIADLRGLDEGWLLATHGDRLNPVVAFEQREEFAQQLRDYAVLSRGAVFFDGNSAFRQSVVDTLADDAAVYGWGDASIGEDVFVGANSDRAAFTIPSDHAHNLAPLSGFPEQQQEQQTHADIEAVSGKHYAAFLMTDGDNVQWLLGTFATDPRWYGSPARGSFDMGYGIAPSLAELAPTVMRWYYANASTGDAEDFFVVGPSGGGYLYPSRYPAGALDTHIERLAGWMALADLNLVQILDAESRERLDLWDRYTAHPEIDGLFYLEYADYSAGQGRVNWSNGKPVVSPRGKLWTGLPNSDTASIIALLNAAGRDSTSPAGYSLVNVAAWDQSYSMVQEVVAGLDADVEIVTPGELVQLMTENIPHEVAFHHDFTGAAWQSTDLALLGAAFWAEDFDSLFQPHPRRLRLTANGGGQVGSAWLEQRLDASRSWSTAFRFQVSHLVAGGADGLAFHLQADGPGANPGLRGAFAGPSLSVIVDTWNNGEGTDESLEVLLDGESIFFNDLTDFPADPRPGATGHVYRVEVDYLAASQRLRIRMFDEESDKALENWVDADLGNLGSVTSGFSASTGASAQNHDIRTWTMAAAAPTTSRRPTLWDKSPRPD